MKNIFKIISYPAIIILLSSCGFQQLNNISNSDIYIKEIQTEGDAKIAQIIRNEIAISYDNERNYPYNLKINIKKDKTYKEKDISGKVKSYYLSVILDVEILDKNWKILNNTNIGTKDSFNLSKNNSNNIVLEKKILENISISAAEKLSKYLNSYFENK